MNRASFFLLLCLFPFMGMAQEPADSGLTRLAERARLFGERIPQEKVFVQMDNTCYFLGDTIWFSAFTRRTNSGRPSKISRVLYAELWNHDGFLVERKLVEMRNGRGSGFFALPDTLYSGYFELRAYTRWQLNWGQTEHPHNKYSELWFYNKAMAKDFFRDYEKLYSRVFPVYDKPKEQGEFNRDMTLRPLRRYFKNDPEPPKLLLSLFPEGGNMVAGMPCRVAFEAALEDGEYCEGTVSLRIKDEELRVKDEKGEEVTEVRTENRGRGSFTFTPEEGKSYEAVFTSSDGKTAKQKIKDFEKEGVSLQVSQQGNEWVLDIHTNLDKPLGMTIMHEGVTSRFAQIKNEKLKIKNEELKAGINQVTIFDEEGRVWADRLFFVTKPELGKSTLIVKGLKDQYGPFEEVNLTISSPSVEEKGAGLALAVRDAVRQDNTFDSGNIMTEMLLSSEIKGFVPQPEWFFEKDDEEHRCALDLLMMTQGWRRFAWQDMAIQGKWEMKHPAEQSQIMNGNVFEYYSDNIYKVAYNLPDTIRDVPGPRIESTPLIMQNRDKKVRENYSDLDEIWKIDDLIARDTKTQLSTHDYQNPEKLKREVKVHAEFFKPDAPKESNAYIGETDTQNGQFHLEAPRFTDSCILFLSASDTTKWDKGLRKKLLSKKYQQHSWIKIEDSEDERLPEEAEFYVRLKQPFPRWTKPYDYYQTHLSEGWSESAIAQTTNDNTEILNEITIRSNRRGLRRMDLSKPVYVVDAYEAANAAMDAGLMSSLHVSDTIKRDVRYTEHLINYTYALARNYIGDMGGSARNYDFSLYLDSIKIAEVRPQFITNLDNDKYDPLDNHYITLNFIGSHEELRQYARLEYQDKIYIYTDYSPRFEGNNRYEQSNQPSVEVRLTHYPNWGHRVTYRDRRYVLHGFAYQEDFYHPDYKRNPPKAGQKDHRRTLYWNPDLKLDENGEAHVTLYNNSRRTQIKVEANGMTSEGGFLYNK